MSPVRALLLAFAFSSLPACGLGAHEDTPVGPGPAPNTVVADFSLADVNPASPTYSTNVSPRQRLSAVSAWYFGHAT